jgi:hypothetical protein
MAPLNKNYRQWTVTGLPHKNKHGRAVVPCECSCGRTKKDVLVTLLKMGEATSCDLCRREKYRRTHGFNYTAVRPGVQEDT